MTHRLHRPFLFYFTPAFFLLNFSACQIFRAEENNTDEAARLSQAQSSPPRVTTTHVRKGDFPLELVSNGKLSAQSKATVRFEVEGQILEVKVKEGQFVEQGQTLGLLESFTYRKAFEKAQNAYDQALIDLEDQLLGFGYNMEDTASIPGPVLKMARIRSGFNTANIALEEARYHLQQTIIRAPISGVVSNLQAEANNPSSEYKFFCEILDHSKMIINFHILETELTFVQPHQPVNIFPFAMDNKSLQGVVTSLNPSVDEQGMVRVTAQIPNPKRELIDGMNAKVILQKRIPECLIIPREAVLYRQNRKVVFVYENGKAIWHYVKTGYENSTEVTITEGLEEGDEVIVENNLNLAHESSVTLKDTENTQSYAE